VGLGGQSRGDRRQGPPPARVPEHHAVPRRQGQAGVEPEPGVPALVAEGALAAASAAEAAREADLVILSLPTPAIVEAVVTGEQGILRTARPGTTVVDMSTGDPGTARRVEAACRAAGVNFLDAPVSRGVMGAEKGTLLIMVGGDEEVLEAARPVLSVLGSEIIHVGGPGSGQVVKLCNNMLSAINMLALDEGLGTGGKAGVELEGLLEAGLAVDGDHPCVGDANS